MIFNLLKTFLSTYDQSLLEPWYDREKKIASDGDENFPYNGTPWM